MGAPEVNGGWDPHLHLQLFTHLAGGGTDLPGVAYPDELDLWQSISPDPNLRPAMLIAASRTFRTDGAFVWPDDAAYYLDKFALSPDPDLLARIRAAGYVPPVVDGVAMHRATALLLQSGNRVSPAVAGTGRQVVR